MSDLVMIENGKVFVTSNMVADRFGKAHRSVMRNVRCIIELHPDFGAHNFVRTSYTTSQNKTHECFEMTRDGFAMLAMGFTGREAAEWKIKYIQAFNKMEDALRGVSPTLKTVNEIVKKAQSDKQIASDCGSQLARYRKIKSKNEADLSEALSAVQISLGFK